MLISRRVQSRARHCVKRMQKFIEKLSDGILHLCDESGPGAALEGGGELPAHL